MLQPGAASTRWARGDAVRIAIRMLRWLMAPSAPGAPRAARAAGARPSPRRARPRARARDWLGVSPKPRRRAAAAPRASPAAGLTPHPAGSRSGQGVPARATGRRRSQPRPPPSRACRARRGRAGPASPRSSPCGRSARMRVDHAEHELLEHPPHELVSARRGSGRPSRARLRRRSAPRSRPLLPPLALADLPRGLHLVEPGQVVRLDAARPASTGSLSPPA